MIKNLLLPSKCRRSRAVFSLILSYHNFKETPSEAFIYSKLVEAQKAGAEISKVAVMPKNYGDVLTLLSATNKARNEMVQRPHRDDVHGARRRCQQVGRRSIWLRYHLCHRHAGVSARSDTDKGAENRYGFTVQRLINNTCHKNP